MNARPQWRHGSGAPGTTTTRKQAQQKRWSTGTVKDVLRLFLLLLFAVLTVAFAVLFACLALLALLAVDDAKGRCVVDVVLLLLMGVLDTGTENS